MSPASPRLRGALLLCAALALPACAPGAFSMKIAVDPVANANYPVALSVVVVYDDKVLPKLLEMNARQWFGQREQFLRDNAKTISEDYFEFVPGQTVQPLKRTLKDKAAGGLVFANYRTAGAHRYVFDPTHNHNVTLGPKGVSVVDLAPPKTKLPSLDSIPTAPPEMPELPSVPGVDIPPPPALPGS